MFQGWELNGLAGSNSLVVSVLHILIVVLGEPGHGKDSGDRDKKFSWNQ